MEIQKYCGKSSVSHISGGGGEDDDDRVVLLMTMMMLSLLTEKHLKIHVVTLTISLQVMYKKSVKWWKYAEETSEWPKEKATTFAPFTAYSSLLFP